MSIKRLGLTLVLLSAVAVLLGQTPAAQGPALSDVQGHVGLGLALRELSTTGTLMQAVAHPDDESNGLLVMLKRGLGFRTVLASATRGDGGQNEIGPELFDALAVLRTAELETMHRLDGAEQYFTRAVDFGYSFSVEETFEKWGREEITADFVRLMRLTRPDVVLAMRPDGAGGGQHHQASAQIVADAFAAAGDPARFPEQIAQGLRPWQPRKLYFMERYGGPGSTGPPPAGVLGIPVERYDPLLGRTYASLGSEARSNHKCQGMAQLLSLPGPSVVQYRLVQNKVASEAASVESLFGGIDVSITGLATFVDGVAPPPLVSGLDAASSHIGTALRAFQNERLFESGEHEAVLPALAGALTEVRALRRQLPDLGVSEAARFEIDTRLATKQGQIERAMLLAQALRFDILASDGVVVGGQPVRTTISLANRGTDPVSIASVAIEGFDGHAGCATGEVKPDSVYRCESSLRVSPGVPATSPYWHQLPGTARYEFDPDVPFGVPFRPTPFVARLELEVAGVRMAVRLPVMFRYEGNIFSGEKRMELKVVPAFSVQVTPGIAIVPASAPAAPKARTKAALEAAKWGVERELLVRVTNGNAGASSAEVGLKAPEGWRVTPSAAPVTFAREDEAKTVRFRVAPPRGTKTGEYRVSAFVRAGGGVFDSGYQVVEYPHIARHHLVHPAAAVIEVIDVSVPAGLTVGYVMGVGDQVPPAIAQLGARVELLDANALAWGDLSRYDVIVTGVRAYERRDDLRAQNHRLLEYVEQGGTLVVQYNKFEFNAAQYGPYPAKVSSNRVTSEQAPVKLLQPAHPVFTRPNRIDEADWTGWVQERGLYFLGEKDSRYADLVELEDPFPFNAGPKRGALVEARYGKGRWIYVGLGLWRQLPAGTPGAYALLANLLALGRAS